jgi:hypothetical protein
MGNNLSLHVQPHCPLYLRQRITHFIYPKLLLSKAGVQHTIHTPDNHRRKTKKAPAHGAGACYFREWLRAYRL